MSRTRLALIALTILEAGFVLGGAAAALGIPSPAWALDFPRFLPPPVAILLVAFSIGALVFAARRRPRIPASRGEILLLAVPAGILLATIALPDHSGFLGDFLLRRGAIAAGRYDRSFPQGLPLDHLLFGRLLPALMALTGVSLDAAARAIGVSVELSLLAIAGTGWRRAGLSPSATALGMLLVGGTGLAAMFTGFARDTVILLPFVLALGFSLVERAEAAGARPLSPGPEWWLLAALSFHRTALVLLVPYLVATWRARRAARPLRWTAGFVALLLGMVVLVPLDFGVFTSFDLSRHTEWLASGRLDLLPLLHPGHLADVLGAIALLAPVAFAGGLIVSPPRFPARVLDVALLAGWLPMAFLIEPQQGVFRDFDVYAPMAVTCAFVGARQLFRLHAIEPVWSSRAARVTAVAGLQGLFAVLFVSVDPAATRARVLDALARGSHVSPVRRAQWLDWLEADAEKSGDRAAAAAFATRAAEAVPSRLRWIAAALAATEAGDLASARASYGRVLAIDSTSVVGWCGVAGSSAALSDPADRDVALAHLRRLVRDSRRRATAVRFVTSSPRTDPTGVVAAVLRDSSRAPGAGEP